MMTPRNCENDLARVKADLTASLDMMAQHRVWVQKRLEKVVGEVRGLHAEVVVASQ